MALTTGITTQADAEARLQLWLDAQEKVAKRQSYAIEGRSLTSVDAVHIDNMIDKYQRIVNRFRAASSGAGNPDRSVVVWKG